MTHMRSRVLSGALVAISLVLGPVAAAASGPALKANHPASSVSPSGSTYGMVADINPGGSSSPRFLTPVGGNVYFAANDGVHGRELWSTDGTTAHMVKNIRPGAGSSNPQGLVNVAGTLYFTATDGVHGRELWKSDGTSAGTKLVRDIAASGGSRPTELTAAGGRVYFAAYDGVHGNELWVSDGTAAGTHLVKDIAAAPGHGSFPGQLTNAGGTLYFGATSNCARNLWKTDGTSTGTTKVFALAPMEIAVSAGTVFFTGFPWVCDKPSGDSNRLMTTDGTPGGTHDVMLPNISRQLTDFEGTLYFSARGDNNHPRMWKSDGTPSGTGKLVPAVPLIDQSGMQSVANALWWANAGAWLWTSDGTASGSHLVHSFSEVMPPFRSLGGSVVYFSATDGQDDWEIWRSDGTGPGTWQVTDINPAGSSSAQGIVRLGGELLFSATDGSNGQELWRISS